MNRYCLKIANLLLVITATVAVFKVLMSFNAKEHHAASEFEWTLTRQAILSLRQAAVKLDPRTCLHIASLGCMGRPRGCRGGRLKATSETETGTLFSSNPGYHTKTTE